MKIRVDHSKRRYRDEERVQAVALTLAVGAIAASEQLGIPRRTIYRWVARDPLMADIYAASRQELTTLFQATVAEAVVVVRAGLRDPKVSLRQKARTLAVLANHRNAIEIGRMWTEVSTLLDDAPE